MLIKRRPKSDESVVVSPKPNVRKRINLGLFACICLYLGLCPPLFYARFEFLPEKYTAAKYTVADKIKHEDVFITLDNGKKIHGWWLETPNAKHTVIIHHGNAKNVAFFFPAAEVFHNVGTNVLLYDYEGFGRSDGPTAHEALRRDSQAVYTFVRNEKKIPANQIVHCGISIGTGAACDIASREPCAGVFLCSPYWRLSDVAKRLLPFMHLYPSFAFPSPDVGGEQIVNTNVPIMIVHGDNDFVISVANAYKIYERAIGQKQLHIVKNGFHVGGLAPGIEDFCKKWLDELPRVDTIETVPSAVSPECQTSSPKRN